MVPRPRDEPPFGAGDVYLPAAWNRWPRPHPAVREALERVYRSGDWGRYHGSECEGLRAELAAYFGGQQVYLCASGTIGIELALRGLGVGAKDEVVLAGYDFPGNFRAIEALGARPVLADVRPDGWTLDPDQVAGALTPHTAAVIVSHLHGELAPMKALCRLARAQDVAVVEDACQAPGAWIEGQPAGTWGDVSVLSFGGSKLLTAGRGGAVLTHDPQLAQRIRIFAERGNDAFALSELQAAVLRPQLQALDQDRQKRQRHVALLIERLGAVACLQAASVPPDSSATAYYKVAWRYRGTNIDRQQLLQALRDRGVPIDVGFRGFALRSPRRCRRVGELLHSRDAAQQTVLLHHPILMQDTEAVLQLAEVMEAVVRELGIETRG